MKGKRKPGSGSDFDRQLDQALQESIKRRKKAVKAGKVRTRSTGIGEPTVVIPFKKKDKVKVELQSPDEVLNRGAINILNPRVAELYEVSEELRRLKARKEKLESTIIGLTKKWRAIKLDFDGVVLNKWVGKTVWIDKRLLLDQGVDPDVIAKATQEKEYPVIMTGIQGKGESA